MYVASQTRGKGDWTGSGNRKNGAEDRWQETHLWHAPHGSLGVPRDTYCHKSQEDTENIPETRQD